jgi:3-methyladenine DNA glycosylase AlkD
VSLWDSGIHDARILASMIDDPALVTEAQMERWVADFASWDLCDQVCANLFRQTQFAHAKAAEWSGRRQEFVKRAGFALIAGLAVADKLASDEPFTAFLAVVARERLNALAIQTACELGRRPSRSARWIASDALRELQSQRIQERLGRSA